MIMKLMIYLLFKPPQSGFLSSSNTEICCCRYLLELPSHSFFLFFINFYYNFFHICIYREPPYKTCLLLTFSLITGLLCLQRSNYHFLIVLILYTNVYDQLFVSCAEFDSAIMILFAYFVSNPLLQKGYGLIFTSPFRRRGTTSFLEEFSWKELG